MSKNLGKEFNLQLAKKVLKKTLEQVEDFNVQLMEDRTMLLVVPNLADDEEPGDTTIICRVKNDAKTRQWHVLVADVNNGQESNARLKRFEMNTENAAKIKEFIAEEFNEFKLEHYPNSKNSKHAKDDIKAALMCEITNHVGSHFDIDVLTSPGGGVMRIKPSVKVDGKEIYFPYYSVVTVIDGAQVMRCDYFRSHLLGRETVQTATVVKSNNNLPIDYVDTYSIANGIIEFFKSKIPCLLETVAESYGRFLHPEENKPTQKEESE